MINSYPQLSRFVEADMVAWNIEGYAQDNWKVNGKLTLDFGVRLVHQTPMYDTRLFASTFLPEAWNASAAPVLYVAGCGANALPTDLLRSIRGFGAITQQTDYGWNTFHSLQLSFLRRFSHGVSFGFNDAVSLRNVAQQTQRLVHNADGSYRLRDDQAQANTLLQTDPIRHTLKANFVWALPKLKRDGAAARAIGHAINDWQLSGVWTATSPQPYTLGFSYTGITSVNLTGSPDYAARIAVTGTEPGSGCSGDTYRQFNTAAFAGPLSSSVGLESSPNVVKGCFRSAFDLAVARIIRIGEARQLQLRVDVFNAPNQAIVSAAMPP